HFPKILRMTGQTAVPVLALDGRPIHDSTRIIEALERAFPEPALYPRNEPGRRRALALEDFFDEELGPSIRAMLVHAQFVHDPGLTAALFTVGMGRGVPRRARRARRLSVGRRDVQAPPRKVRGGAGVTESEGHK